MSWITTGIKYKNQITVERWKWLLEKNMMNMADMSYKRFGNVQSCINEVREEKLEQ
jgi:hypothetical protein